MYPYIQIILPSYAVLAFMGFFLVVIFLFFRLEKFEVDFGDYIKMFFLCVLMAYLGSKLMYALTQIPQLLKDFSIKNLIMLIPDSGFVYYGGLFGVLLGIFFYVKKTSNYSLDSMYTMIAPGIPLFHSFGRIGCFMAGCCYGKQLHTPYIIAGSIVLERVPTQLLEAAFELGLFLFLILLEQIWKGNILKVYLLLYAIFRFIIEFFRGDDIRGIWYGLSTAQWVSIFVLIALFLKKIRSHKCSPLEGLE